MAVIADYPAKLAVGSLYVSSANEIMMGDRAAMNDASDFGHYPYAAFAQGLKTVTLAVNGWQDYSTLTSISTAERTRDLTGPVAISCSPLGAVAGAYATFSVGIVDTMARREAQVGQIPRLALVFQPTGIPLVQGFVSDPGTTDRTGTYTGTGAQLGALSATQRIYANIHVLDTTGSGGTPSITPRIESDNAGGFGTPTTVVTGTAMTPTVGTGASQTISALGPLTDDFFRIQCTISGTTPHLLIFAVIGIAKLAL